MFPNCRLEQASANHAPTEARFALFVTATFGRSVTTTFLRCVLRYRRSLPTSLSQTKLVSLQRSEVVAEVLDA